MRSSLSQCTDLVLSNVHNPNILLLGQHEANELIPEIHESRQTTLHVYVPRSSKWMRSFGNLRFLCTGKAVKDEQSFHNDNYDLELFAGSLYFVSFKIYENVRHFLGLVTEHTSQMLGNRLSNEGFVGEQTRQEVEWPVQSPFWSNPLPLLGAIFNIRSKGHGYLQTHMGRMLASRELTEDKFYPKLGLDSFYLE
ncbi:hypothetical protein FE257_005657 [Aspergillus nanangensis]|uniref:Uncharacterized protein n=1 Tax=Aspergillus nanangensis TaxID=2582783 RepID=A0AAD4GMQ9_ASPNN|nr:hypothetical protein FE257_005657 [Aspergillus nanangensis]